MTVVIRKKKRIFLASAHFINFEIISVYRIIELKSFIHLKIIQTYLIIDVDTVLEIFSSVK